jgi:hypothetical protein
MLRLSSQSKSTPWDEVADTSATGMCTKPKLIAPFQIARGMSVFLKVWGSSGDTVDSAKVSPASRLAAVFQTDRVTPDEKLFSYQSRTQGVACYRKHVLLAPREALS